MTYKSLNYTPGDNIRGKYCFMASFPEYCQFYSLKNHSKSYRLVKVNVIEEYYKNRKKHLSIPFLVKHSNCKHDLDF